MASRIVRGVKHSHLQLRRSTYFMRRRVPQDLKDVLGRGEIIESLRTKDRAEAKRRLNARLVELDQEWSDLRHRLTLAQADPEGTAMAELKAALAADHQARLDGAYRRHRGTIENDPALAEVQLHEAMERLAEASSRGRSEPPSWPP